MNKHILFFLFGFLSPYFIKAQVITSIEKDSIVSSILLQSYNFQSLDTGSFFYDTTLLSILNKPSIFFNFQLNLGNKGTAQYFLDLNKTQQNIGFFGQFDHLSMYRKKSSDYAVLWVNKPFTVFNYLNGTRQEEEFSVIHTQPIKRFNVGFEISSSNSQGFYESQQTSHKNFVIFSNYKDSLGIYSSSLVLAINQGFVKENGGINDFNGFLANDFSREFIGVNLRNARNGSDVRNLFFSQSYILKKTLKVDTIMEENGDLVLLNTLEFKEEKYDFADIGENGLFDSSYYERLPFGVPRNEVRSVTKNQEMNAYLGIRKSIGKQTSIDFQGGAFFQFGKISDFNSNLNYSNLILDFKSRMRLKNKFLLNANYQTVVAGFNNFDYILTGDLGYEVYKELSISGFIHSQLMATPFIYTNFYSTINSWNNKFNKEGLNEFGGILVFKNAQILKIGSGLFSNPAYFSAEGLPKQLGGSIGYYYAQLQYEFKFSIFRLEPNIKFQNYQSNIIPLPNQIYFTRFYITGWLFNHHMLADFGADLFYTSNYSGYGYLPLTRQFTLNEGSDYFGYYPFIDVFFAAKVKTLRIFVKASHLNNGFSGSNYFTAQNYPYHDFSFRFGFNWIFLN